LEIIEEVNNNNNLQIFNDAQEKKFFILKEKNINKNY